MKKRICVWLFFIFLYGCESSEEKNKETQIEVTKVSPRENRVQVDQSKPRRIEEEVTKSVARITRGSFVDEMRGEILSYNHPSFNEPATESMVAEAVSKKLLLSDELRSSNESFADQELKDAVIGRFSLYTGLLGAPDPETTPKVPEIFVYEDIPTVADVLTLRMVKQAVEVAQKRVSIKDEDLPSWINLASSNNKIYRLVALVLFDLIEPTPEQSDRFFSSYENEKNKIVLELLQEKKRDHQ